MRHTSPHNRPNVRNSVKICLQPLVLSITSTPLFVSLSNLVSGLSHYISHPTDRFPHCYKSSLASRTTPPHHPTVDCTVTYYLDIFAIHLMSNTPLITLSQIVLFLSPFALQPLPRTQSLLQDFSMTLRWTHHHSLQCRSPSCICHNLLHHLASSNSVKRSVYFPLEFCASSPDHSFEPSSPTSFSSSSALPASVVHFGATGRVLTSLAFQSPQRTRASIFHYHSI